MTNIFYLQPVYSDWKFGECEAPKLLQKDTTSTSPMN